MCYIVPDNVPEVTEESLQVDPHLSFCVSFCFKGLQTLHYFLFWC